MPTGPAVFKIFSENFNEKIQLKRLYAQPIDKGIYLKERTFSGIHLKNSIEFNVQFSLLNTLAHNSGGTHSQFKVSYIRNYQEFHSSNMMTAPIWLGESMGYCGRFNGNLDI